MFFVEGGRNYKKEKETSETRQYWCFCCSLV